MSEEKFATQEEIKYASSILIGENKFDPEKIVIIECNESKDIKACPGSGKTTALLAKLVILANRMPLENNRGICVLTHTNVAIDEIKSKIGNKSDILFKYPNHFGTIQSFVDKYLAIPSLLKYFNSKIVRIDTEIALKMILKNFNFLNPFISKLHKKIWGTLFSEYSIITKKQFRDNNTTEEIDEVFNMLEEFGIIKKIKNKFKLDSKSTSISQLNKLDIGKELTEYLKKLRSRIDKNIQLNKDDFLKRLSVNYIERKILYNENDNFGGFETPSSQEFLELKENLFRKGILTYKDAYILASRYINDYKSLQKVFSSRFKYVFVDEMQDTDKSQNEVIDSIFDDNETIIQKFGDPDQAIYNIVKADEIWKIKEPPLPIENSKRFGENIAKVLRSVCVKNNESLKGNEEINSIEPIIIVFEKPEKVLSKYCELITTFKIGENTIWELSEQEKLKIKAVGWVGEPNKEDRKEDKLTIQSYFGNFRKNLKRKETINPDSLKSFLVKINKAKSKDYSNRIIDSILQILLMDKKKNKVGNKERNYSKTSFLNEFKEKYEKDYQDFLVRIAIWARKINSSRSYEDSVVKEIRNYFKSKIFEIFKINNKNENILNFIDKEIGEDFTSEQIIANNIYDWSNNKNVKIELGTIHSAKGETHASTLYLETFYQGKYESESIINQLLGNPYVKGKNKDTHVKETLKMVYVGMSRPRYLLCMAIHKSRYDDRLDIKNDGMWKIVNA